MGKSYYKLQLKSIYPNRFYYQEQFFFGKSFAIYFDISESNITLNKNIQFRDFCTIRSGTNSSLLIGKNVFFNNNCSINCLQNIQIGDDCQFGESLKMYDYNHKYQDKSLPIKTQGYSLGSIKIGNNCWVGSNVVILKGVEIGDNVIIGAGCIVYKSIPSNTTLINKQVLEFK